MSHIVQIKSELKCVPSIENACDRLGLARPVSGTHQMFSSQTATGLAVNLPNWHYPIVINPETGAVEYDNYNGSWGDQSELDKFLQAYAVEKATYEAQVAGYSVYEETLEDGSIKLTVDMGE
jgi:hypothetical protein